MKYTFVAGALLNNMVNRFASFQYKNAGFPTPNREQLRAPFHSSDDSSYIYIACPWSPGDGGMHKVADYLIQCQAEY